jgi:hypothetical protein
MRDREMPSKDAPLFYPYSPPKELNSRCYIPSRVTIQNALVWKFVSKTGMNYGACGTFCIK